VVVGTNRNIMRFGYGSNLLQIKDAATRGHVWIEDIGSPVLQHLPEGSQKGPSNYLNIGWGQNHVFSEIALCNFGTMPNI